MTQDINAILAQRRGTHGSFSENARVVEALMNVYRSAPNWGQLPDTAREVMHMVAHKQARILSGNPHEPDHWLDISGYAKLEHDECVRRAAAADKAAAASEAEHAARGAQDVHPDRPPSGMVDMKPGDVRLVPGWVGRPQHHDDGKWFPRDGTVHKMWCDCVAIWLQENNSVYFILDRNALTLYHLERLGEPRLPPTPNQVEYAALMPYYQPLYRKNAEGRWELRPWFRRWSTV